MSRWSYGTWIVAAVVIEEDGDIYPISELYSRRGLIVQGCYEQVYWSSSERFKLQDIAGEVECRYEGDITIRAHLCITDKNGKVNFLDAECDGYTCCGEDSYMLLILTPSNDAGSCTLEFQEVDEVELKEALGKPVYDEWLYENRGKDTFVAID